MLYREEEVPTCTRGEWLCKMGPTEFLETPCNGLADSVSGRRGNDIGSRFRLRGTLLGLYQYDFQDWKTLLTLNNYIILNLQTAT